MYIYVVICIFNQFIEHFLLGFINLIGKITYQFISTLVYENDQYEKTNSEYFIHNIIFIYSEFFKNYLFTKLHMCLLILFYNLHRIERPQHMHICKNHNKSSLLAYCIDIR